MFIAFQYQQPLRSSGAPCALVRALHSAPSGAGWIRIWGYKHVAPPEQEPSISDDDDFSAKPLEL